MQDKSDVKVLFAIKTLTYSVGGAERLAAILSGAMAERGIDTHLLTFDAKEDVSFFDVHSKITRHWVETIKSLRKTRLWEVPQILLSLRRQAKEIQPDIVVAFMHSMFVPMQCALIGTGIKVVLSEHTAPLYYQTRKAELWILRFFCLFAHSATIVSDAVRALYPRDIRRKMVILPNPVHSDFGMADAAGMGKTEKTVLSVGRLDPGKDHKILIEAFFILAADYPDWRLLIIGEGPERNNLESLIALLNMERRVYLPGVTHDIDSIYKAAQIFVMPSRFESFGLVTAEAMSHALPVVGFADCSGTNELVEDGVTGCLVQNRKAEDLAFAMRTLMDDPEKRDSCGKIGYKRSLKYAQEAVCMKWAEYIEKQVRTASGGR